MPMPRWRLNFGAAYSLCLGWLDLMVVATVSGAGDLWAVDVARRETAKNGLHILLGGICALTVVVFFRF
ncbi:hypothetical protein OROMI_024078 [Orobanche minor]